MPRSPRVSPTPAASAIRSSRSASRLSPVPTRATSMVRSPRRAQTQLRLLSPGRSPSTIQPPTTEVVIHGDVYVRGPQQWVRGTLTVSRDRLHFAGHVHHSSHVVAAPMAAVRRCRVLPSTGAEYDVGVFELTFRAEDTSAGSFATWSRLGTPVGTLWLKAATTNDAIEWAEAIDDAASAAHDAAQGRDSSWFHVPTPPLSMTPAASLCGSPSSWPSAGGTLSDDDGSSGGDVMPLTLPPAAHLVEHYARLAKHTSSLGPPT